jgi:hypothetical protein
LNSKQAKRLRKDARESAPELPWVSYEALKGVNKYRMPYVQVVLAECSKAVYKGLKKSFKKDLPKGK